MFETCRCFPQHSKSLASLTSSFQPSKTKEKLNCANSARNTAIVNIYEHNSPWNCLQVDVLNGIHSIFNMYIVDKHSLLITIHRSVLELVNQARAQRKVHPRGTINLHFVAMQRSLLQPPPHSPHKGFNQAFFNRGQIEGGLPTLSVIFFLGCDLFDLHDSVYLMRISNHCSWFDGVVICAAWYLYNQ